MVTIRCKYNATDFIYVDPQDERMREFRDAVKSCDGIYISVINAPYDMYITYGGDRWHVRASGEFTDGSGIGVEMFKEIPSRKDGEAPDDVVERLIAAIERIDGSMELELGNYNGRD